MYARMRTQSKRIFHVCADIRCDNLNLRLPPLGTPRNVLKWQRSSPFTQLHLDIIAMTKSTCRRNPPSNPSQRTTKGTRTITPETEERLAEAEAALRQGECKTYRQASERFNVPYFTLRRRCRDEAAPKTKAHLAQLLLPPASEEILVDWIKFLSATGHPVNKRTIRPKVQTLMKELGRNIPDSSPSKSWIRRFLDRHPELKLGRGSGLDPKRAKAFKTFQQKFFFSRADTSKYKLKSDDLQLVTIIEAVCADGSSDIPPGFVFAGSTKFPEWFKCRYVRKWLDR
ncbi:hypothetical protein IW262DRAFT_1344268 [Armillaria fumosa]|nr:hypothetical protein IW262DRAFT_1344268 [Armillaria fumosa]